MPRVKWLFSPLTILLCLLAAEISPAQCILRNPSFEVGGSGGDVFGGWNQFGNVWYTTTATHGSRAARATGPNTGTWDVSGYWQQFDSAPGDRWAASVKAWHSSGNPVTGGSAAILNIEWRDASDALISYESHAVVNASTPFDEVQELYVESQAAPSGTVKARILLGALQDPSQPAPTVYFDEVTFHNLASPPESYQWNDFPSGRTIQFSGREWRVKGNDYTYYSPGYSMFGYGDNSVWVDAEDRLHLSVKYLSGNWYSSEVTLVDALGYGDYIFTTRGDLDLLDQNVVFGLFLWEYGPCWNESYLWWNPYNEIDVEFSRWDAEGHNIAQFVAQPYDYPGNLSSFDATFSEDEITSHAFRWLPDRVEFRSWRGGPLDESTGPYILTWTYTGPHIPRPEQPRVHLNLWQFNGPPETDQEVVLERFSFYPQGVVAGAEAGDPMGAGQALLSPAWPNPFNPATTIDYRLPAAGTASIIIYDVAGRRVRTLVSGFVTAGDHSVSWDGRDDSGHQVASGVYLYQLRADDVVATRKMVLLK